MKDWEKESLIILANMERHHLPHMTEEQYNEMIASRGRTNCQCISNITKGLQSAYRQGLLRGATIAHDIFSCCTKAEDCCHEGLDASQLIKKEAGE